MSFSEQESGLSALAIEHEYLSYRGNKQLAPSQLLTSCQEKILIVDDQTFNIEAIKIIFEHKLKLDPSLFKSTLSGEEALKIIDQNINYNKL